MRHCYFDIDFIYRLIIFILRKKYICVYVFFSELGSIYVRKKERKKFFLLWYFDIGIGGYMSVVGFFTTSQDTRRGYVWKPFSGWHGSLKQHSCLPRDVPSIRGFFSYLYRRGDIWLVIVKILHFGLPYICSATQYYIRINIAKISLLRKVLKNTA